MMRKSRGYPLNRAYHFSTVVMIANLTKSVNEKIKLIFSLTSAPKTCILIEKQLISTHRRIL